MRPLHWLLNAANKLLQKIPPPKAQRLATEPITPEQPLTPTEREIIARAEQSLQALEAQSQAVLARIRESPVIVPAPAPIQLVDTANLPHFPAATVAEFLEVPEVSEVSGILATVEPTQATTATPEGWAVIEGGTEPSSANLNRTLVVEGLLDEAWQQGLRTYAQLIKYVELNTGKGCSKRAVSSWKRSRRLDSTAA